MFFTTRENLRILLYAISIWQCCFNPVRKTCSHLWLDNIHELFISDLSRCRFASAPVHLVQPVRYEYLLFLNLEPKSEFHFLYLATIFRQHFDHQTPILCRYTSRISIGSNACTNFLSLPVFMKESACRTVSLCETRTAVHEWACYPIIIILQKFYWDWNIKSFKAF